jgi:MoaA/NifB/PqqE/SkfB family radical SAM enzyme
MIPSAPIPLVTLREQERSSHASLHAVGDLDERMGAAMGDRLEEWRAYREDWKRGVAERPFPLQLDFSLNDSCNMRCPMCTWSDDNKQATRRLFSIAHYTQILADAVPRGLKAVGLNGVNEPLMRRDLPDFVRIARDFGVLDIMLHTNGMLLNNVMARGLIDAGLTRLFVSLDAVTQTTYDTIRVGGDLKIVTRNIDNFLAVRSGRTLPVLAVCFVRMSLNAHEEEAFVEQWRDRADFLSMQSYMNPWSADRPEKDALASVDRAPAKPFVCAQPFQRMRVTVDGIVRPCCAFYGDQIEVGRIDQPMQQIWDGHMSTMRYLHSSGRVWDESIPAGSVCRQCMRNSYTEAAPQ